MGSPKYSNEELLSALNEANEKVVGPITQGEFNRVGSVAQATLQRRFGDWNSAKEAAGIETIGKHQNKLPGLPYERKRQKAIQVREAVPCTHCGENLPACATDFHHIRGTKFRSVMDMTSYSWERIKEEMKKCDVLCANCHRIAEHRK